MLQCGQGDTILLNLGARKWVLVDCNLPQGEARAQFFRLVEQLQIRRLDLVCLSHPHEDHYTGLAEVMQYFTSEGRTVGTFCDSGVEPRQIQQIMRRRRFPASAVTEFERLYRFVYKLIENNRVRYFRADENRSPLVEVGDRIRLIPIGPRPEVVSEAVRDVVSEGKIRRDLNRVSVVLGLNVRGNDRSFDALLAADTDSEGCNNALNRYAVVRNGSGHQPALDMVKVSHHGSGDSHRGSRICGHRKDIGVALAVISAGSFDVLPDREVMRDFLQAGWTVLLTEKRITRAPQLAVELSGRGRGGLGVRSQNIWITWREEQGTRWEPPEARVDREELSHYESVLKPSIE